MIDPPSDSDRLRESFISLAPAAGGTPGCSRPEAIWRALMGEASPGESGALVDHTIECATCAAAWRLARSIAVEAGVMPAEVVPAPAALGPALKPGVRRWIAIAAAVLLVAVALALLGRGRGVDPWQETVIAKAAWERPASEDDLLWRGPGSGTADETALFLEAMRPYEADDFAGAERSLATFLGDHPDHTRALLYRGVCLLMLDRPAEAATSLESAASRADPLLRDEADWYLALAEGRAGRRPEAIERLRSIAAGASPRAVEARRLLQRIEPPPD